LKWYLEQGEYLWKLQVKHLKNILFYLFPFLLPEPGRAYSQIQDFSHFVFIPSLNKNSKNIYFIIFSC
jgi:hypothetical protein